MRSTTPDGYTRPSVISARSSSRTPGRRSNQRLDPCPPRGAHSRNTADAGYQGSKAAKAVADTGRWVIVIVKRTDAHNFVVLPKRWIVERTFAWIARNRRLARDFERYARTGAAFVRLAMIRLMLRRLTRPSHST
jgi:transposase